jgi:hypothetical protein
MMKNITVFLFFIFCRISFSQSQFIQYYSNINLAQHYIIYKQYFKADSCFKIAFALDSIRGFNQDYLSATSNSLYLKDTALTKFYLYGYAKRGGNYKKIKTRRVIRKATLDSIFFKDKALRKRMSVAFKEYKKTLNKEVVSKIRHIVIRDQMARVGPINILPWKIQRKIMIKVDKRSIKELLLICKQYGWPGYNLIGEFRPWGKSSIRGADLIIRHFSIEELKKLEPYVFGAIKQVNEYPIAWAKAIDYCYLKLPLCKEDSIKFVFTQKYGTMFSRGAMFSEDTAIANKMVIIPFGKIEEVNTDRKELFLEPIEDYCKWYNVLLPKEEKAIKYKNKKGNYTVY